MDLMDYIQPEDSPELTDSEIESSIKSSTEHEFVGQVVSHNACACGGWRYMRETKQLLRQPFRYGRISFACTQCDVIAQTTFRMDWLTG